MPRSDLVRRWFSRRTFIVLAIVLVSSFVLAAVVRADSPPESGRTASVAQAGTAGEYGSEAASTTAPPPAERPATACPDLPGTPVRILAEGKEADGAVITANPLGNTEDGVYYPDRLYVPPDPREVSWLNYADIGPGADHGTAVLTSHVDYGGVRGALADITTYVEGQRFTVVLADGRQLGYRVVTARTMGFDVDTVALSMPKTDFNASPELRTAIFDFGGQWSDGALPCGRIVLVTCTGSFINGSYTDNSYVFALPDPVA